jgi:hypothetical protein
VCGVTRESYDTAAGSVGIIGILMSAGIISATPLWVPLAVGSAAASAATGLGYGGYQLYKLKNKISNTAGGKDARFTEKRSKDY